MFGAKNKLFVCMYIEKDTVKRKELFRLCREREREEKPNKSPPCLWPKVGHFRTGFGLIVRSLNLLGRICFVFWVGLVRSLGQGRGGSINKVS